MSDVSQQLPIDNVECLTKSIALDSGFLLPDVTNVWKHRGSVLRLLPRSSANALLRISRIRIAPDLRELGWHQLVE